MKPDWVILNARRMLPVVNELRIPSAPVNMTLAFATDIHLRKPMDGEKIAEIIGNTQADALILGGDIADTAEDCERMLRLLKPLSFPLGKFSVCGNNDLEAFGSYERVNAAFDKNGIQLLWNSGVQLGRVFLGGVSECKTGLPDCKRTLQSAEKDSYRVLVSHYPLKKLLPNDADLMMAGHTHGGQFNFLGITPYTVGYEWFRGIRQVAGVREYANTRLLVSKGIGTSKIPLRIGVKSEIHKIILGRTPE